jgi:nicotinamide-nucleotide amidase
MNTLAFEVHEALARRGETVAAAESLTGGLFGATVTEVPGVSATYRGGLIVYATDLKATLAGVSETLLRQRGAVDPDVAIALAAGVRTRLAASWGLGLTGVAGPNPQDGKAAGTVFIGLARPDGECTVETLALVGDRAQIRAETVRLALTVLRDALESA